MNYAQDRLDRRVLDDSSYQTTHHGDWAQTLMIAGWNRQALYHYGQAWQQDPGCADAAADFAQMAELAGYPWLGLASIWVYRIKGRMKLPTTSNMNKNHQLDKDWWQQCEPTGDCGCGDVLCGQKMWLPFETSAVESVLELLQAYLQCEHSQESTAHQVLQNLLAVSPRWSTSSSQIPPPLQFWVNNDNNLRPLPKVMQLLLIKLLYLTIPSLAALAVVHVDYKNGVEDDDKSFKSHWAYYVLIRAVLLGRRIKSSRKHVHPYHVPVWDLIWQLDRRRDIVPPQQNGMTMLEKDRPGPIQEFLSRLRRLVLHHPDQPLLYTLPTTQATPLYLVGDSHVLSLAWQHVVIGEKLRLAVPVVVTGLKAWHVRSETRFFTQTCLKTMLSRLDGSTIIMSAGEIDCREGLGGPLLEGYNVSCHDHLERTVDAYVQALQQLVAQFPKLQQVLVMPVPPHAHNAKGRVVGRAARRETTRQWNQALRQRLPCQSVYFLDYEASLLDPPEHVLQPALNADSTHMNSAFLRYLEQAVMQCGCDLDLL